MLDDFGSSATLKRINSDGPTLLSDDTGMRTPTPKPEPLLSFWALQIQALKVLGPDRWHRLSDIRDAMQRLLDQRCDSHISGAVTRRSLDTAI